MTTKTGKKEERAGQASNKPLNISQAAKYLNVSRSTMHRWQREGRIEGKRVGAKWYFHPSALDMLVEVGGREAERRSHAIDDAMDQLLAAQKSAKVDAKHRIAFSDYARESFKSSVPGPVGEKVREFVAQLLLYGLVIRATDLHIEPELTRTRIRARVDNTLREVISIPAELSNLVATELKTQLGCDVAVRNLPQDCKRGFAFGDFEFQCYLSTIPGLYGEAITLRILNAKAVTLDIDRLGLPKAQIAWLKKLIARPNGVVIVTGPSNTGKTTTIYCCLTHLSSERRKLMTIEDPVEVDLPGVSQGQVDAQSGYDFLHAVRVMLRHAPDVIFCGEVRDPETMQLLAAAGRTGHLVFTTLHKPGALAALQTVVALGVAAEQASVSVIGIVAQRLFRRICPHCRQKCLAPDADLKALGLADNDRGVSCYQGKGCPQCGDTGFNGRILLAETLEITPALRTAVAQGADRQALAKLARQEGFQTLQEQGMQKVRAGEITLSDLAQAMLTV